MLDASGGGLPSHAVIADRHEFFLGRLVDIHDDDIDRVPAVLGVGDMFPIRCERGAFGGERGEKRLDGLDEAVDRGHVGVGARASSHERQR